ncbi:MAG: ABC transporter permease [Zetaproteobacteria bacterium]|nr:ABC transporter permease [Zetaproteobacteria bacterium]
MQSIEDFGRYVVFVGQTFRQGVVGSVSWPLVFQQMEFIGVRSLSIILLAAMMIGTVFGIQFGSVFKVFGAESLIGAASAYAISKELAPVVGGFLVTGRAGSAMTAEISIMRINDQVDALKVMGISPISYLIVPRVLASLFMMPLLCVIFVLAGVVSCYCIGVWVFHVDTGVFIEKIKWMSKPRHIFQGMEKAAVFGMLFSTICCFRGYHASGGARGVGRATTSAVVLSLVTILLVDFVISFLQLDSALF